MTAYPVNALSPYMMANPMASLGSFSMGGMMPGMMPGMMMPGSIFSCGYDGQFGGLDAYSPDAPMMGGYGFGGMGFGMPYGMGYNTDQYLSDYTKYMKGMTKAGIETNGIQIDGQRDLMKQSYKAQLANVGMSNAYNLQYNAPVAALNQQLGNMYTAATGNNQQAIGPTLDAATDKIMEQARQLGNPISRSDAKALAIQQFPTISGGKSYQELVAESGSTDFGWGVKDAITLGLLGNKKSPSESIAEFTGVPESPEQKIWKGAGQVVGYTGLAAGAYGIYRAATHEGTPGFFARLFNPDNWRWVQRLRGTKIKV